MGTLTVWFFKILQNIFFCVQHNKETYTGLERHGWVNYHNILILGWAIPSTAYKTYNAINSNTEILTHNNYLNLIQQQKLFVSSDLIMDDSR